VPLSSTELPELVVEPKTVPRGAQLPGPKAQFGRTAERESLFRLVASAMVCVAVACGSDDGETKTSWHCLLLTDGCTCSQPRPGWMPNPGGTQVDKCPAAQCCLLNVQPSETTLAYCGCETTSDDCGAKAMSSQSTVVATCPPP
jgi:hypothetical protein